MCIAKIARLYFWKLPKIFWSQYLFIARAIIVKNRIADIITKTSVLSARCNVIACSFRDCTKKVEATGFLSLEYWTLNSQISDIDYLSLNHGSYSKQKGFVGNNNSIKYFRLYLFSISSSRAEILEFKKETWNRK